MTTLPQRWRVCGLAEDVADASLAHHLDMVAAALALLALGACLGAGIAVLLVLGGHGGGPGLTPLLPDAGSLALAALTTPASLVCFAMAAVLGGIALALKPSQPGQAGSLRVGREAAVPSPGLSRRDMARRLALVVTVGPALYAARLIRLLREERSAATCGFRGCQVQLFDPRVRCGCGRFLPGTWPGYGRPLAVVCPGCGHSHPTALPLRLAEAAGTLRIAHDGCPLRESCHDPADLPVIAIIGLDQGLLVDFIDKVGKGRQPEERALHRVLVAERTSPTMGGTPWPDAVPRARIVFGSSDAPPLVDGVLFLCPPGLTDPDTGLGLAPGEVASALAPATAVLTDRRRPPGRLNRLLSMPVPSLDDGRRTVRFGIWIPVPGAYAAPGGTITVLSDVAKLSDWLQGFSQISNRPGKPPHPDQHKNS